MIKIKYHLRLTGKVRKRIYKAVFKVSSPKIDQHQFSPNKINTQ